jgi:ketosteroid isomerase-like protein
MLYRLAILVALISGAIRAADPVTADLIRSAERKWNEAILRRDAPAMAGFLSDSYFLAIGIEGQPLLIVPRAQWLQTLEAYRLESQSIDDMQVHVYGDMAVVAMTYRQVGTAPGARDISGNFLLSDIWIKTKDGWRVAERHSSRQEKLPAAKK